MNIIKTNIWSIICGIVALLCLVVPFWPMGSYETELRTKAEERATVYNDLKSLLDRPRPAPVVNPDNPRAQDLGQFPTDAIIKASENALGNLKSESKKLLQAAEEISHRNRRLLVKDSLPAVSSNTDAYKFKEQYSNSVPGELLKILKAGMPPTKEEIEAAKADIEKGMLDKEIDKPEIDRTKQQVANQRKARAADSCLMYVDPNVIQRHQGMALLGGKAPSQKDIWNAQLLYWIHEDIALAIARVNSESKNVRTSPIKRLRRLEIGSSDLNSGIVGSANNQDPIKSSLDRANVKLTGYKPDEDIKPNPALSATGRGSCGMYDVIRFRLEMDVDATNLSGVLQNLSCGGFITVLTVQRVRAVDRATELAGEALSTGSATGGSGVSGGYVYGDNPVANVILDCEMLYLRSWTIKLMPEDVKKSYAEENKEMDGHR